MELGYRLIDTAQMYDNEEMVGKAVRESGLPRQDIFLTTKLYRSSASYQKAKAGINKTILGKLGGEVHCFMSDPDVAAEAKERGITRAIVSMERAAKLSKPCIFAIGNAPTALISLHEQIQAGTLHPALIVGVPVGFVNVVESKELILDSKVPYIVARGRKGGSNVAAAICNALLYQIMR